MGGALFCRTCSTFDALDTTYKLHSFIVFDATQKHLPLQGFFIRFTPFRTAHRGQGLAPRECNTLWLLRASKLGTHQPLLRLFFCSFLLSEGFRSLA